MTKVIINHFFFKVITLSYCLILLKTCEFFKKKTINISLYNEKYYISHLDYLHKNK